MANPANRLPPDFDDMHPRDYDPEFTANINTKMRVPERIGLVDDEIDVRLQQDYVTQTTNVRHSMNVPERILIAGQDEHVGLREDLRFDMDPTLPHEKSTYIGLSTPPRSLKLDENIYSVNEDVEHKLAMTSHKQAAQNGYVSGPVSRVSFEGDGDKDMQLTPTGKARPDLEALTTPGGGLLLQDSDDDEVAILKRQVMKLTRHVVNLQQENEKRSQRELIFYPIVLGYVILQVARWFLRNN